MTSRQFKFITRNGKIGWVLCCVVVLLLSVMLVTGSDDVETTTATSTTASTRNEPIKVSVIGLGSMGMAIVKCLALGPHLVKIHAWNRGEVKRKALQEQQYFNVHVHQTAETAIASGDIILSIIDDWNGTIQLLQEESIDVWKSKPYRKQKSLVLFSTYSPSDLKKFQETSEIGKLVNIIGGAIVSVPEMICTKKGFILSSISTPENVDPTDKYILDSLGAHNQFTNDNSLAALANIALLQGITFGLVGYEMTQLLFKQYGVSYDFIQQYNFFAKQVIPAYIGMLLPLIFKGIPYVPASTFLNVMKLHLQFMSDIGINNDTYLGAYVHYLNLLVKDDTTTEKVGPDKWINYATIDKSSSATAPQSKDEL